MAIGAAPAFVGREDELRLIAELLEAVSGGAGTTLFVEGEAGMGKSRLVGEAAVLAARRGFVVLRGECDEAARARPFGPLAQAFGSGGGSARTQLTGLDEIGGANVERDATAAGQFRILELIGDHLERAATASPVALVVDDLHWADTSTLVALRSIARRINGLPVVLLMTSRPDHDFAELHRLVDALVRAGGRHLSLAPFDEDAVAALASEVVRAQPGASLLARLKGAAGNPLFVIEYTNALLHEDLLRIHQGVAEVDDGVLPLEFRQTVLRRLRQLSESSIAMLRMASVLGSTFSPADLSAAVSQSVVELAPLLQESVDAGVVGEHGDSLSFVHDLVHDAVYQSIPFAVRKQLHREIGRSLAAADRPPMIVAHHLSLGADERDDEAATWLERAAEDVAARAPTVAVELLERARDLLSAADPRREELLARLVMPLAWSGRLADAEGIARRVLDRRPPPSVTGPLRCGLVYALGWQGRPQEALKYAVLDAGEQLREPDALLLRAQAAVARMFAFDLRGAAADAAAVVQKAAMPDHELALCTALGVETFLASFSGETSRAVELGRKAVAVADRRANGNAHLAAPRFFLALPLIAADLLDEAEHVLQTGRRVAEELGHVWSLPLYHAYLGTTRFVAGEWDDAIAEFEASLDIADEVGMRMIAFVAVSAWLAVILVHRDELERAEAAIASADRRVSEAGPQIGMSLLAWARALVQEARGNITAAVSVLQTAWDFSVAAGLQAEPWSGAALVRLYARAGEPQRAAALVPVMEAQADGNPTPFIKARALWAGGIAASNPEMLTQAVELYRQSPRPHELALACEDAAVLLEEIGRTDEAVGLLDEAIIVYEKLAAERDLARARATLRGLGVRRGRRGVAPRASHGWESLTPTELRVAALVAQRLSNPEVAERLFISRHTVESHLKHIYAKLGISSRLDLAAEAVRRGARFDAS